LLSSIVIMHDFICFANRFIIFVSNIPVFCQNVCFVEALKTALPRLQKRISESQTNSQKAALAPLNVELPMLNEDDISIEMEHETKVKFASNNSYKSLSKSGSNDAYDAANSRERRSSEPQDRGGGGAAAGEASKEKARRGSVSVLVRPTGALPPEVERLRTQDINPDQNSAAFMALQAAANGTIGGVNGGEGSGPGGEAGTAPTMRRTSIARQLTGKFQKSTRKVEGREVQQDHAQYALTYGLMLGIRVMVRTLDVLFLYVGFVVLVVYFL
jgi:hypothetical protein